MGRLAAVGLLGSPRARDEHGLGPSDADGPAPTGPSRSAATRPVRDRPLLLGVLAVAVALTAFGLARHAMWFDELQAWNIARASRSIPDLFHHLRYEGHPAAWYLVLYALTRVTGDPRAMQGVELLIVAGTYAVVLFASPFSKPLRVALLAGYTLSFEYGVISRGYGLGVLALVATLALLGRPRPRWKWALVTAGVLAWTSLAGAVVALALAGAVAGRADPRPTPGPGRDRRWFVAGTGVAAVAAALTCIPPADFHAFTPSVSTVATGGTAGWNRLLTAATGTWRGLVPIPSRLGAWNSQVLDRLPAAPWVEAGLSVVVVVLMAGALRRFPTARRLWLLGSGAGFVFFAVVVVPDQARYAATTFLVFLGAVWWALAPPGAPDDASDASDATVTPVPTRSSRRLRQLVTVVVAAQVVALLAVYPSQTARRFAPNQAVADIVRAAGLQSHLVSGQDFDATSVAAYLDRPVYSVARHAWIRFFIHDDREARRFNTLRATDVLCTARQLARTGHHTTAVITEGPLPRLGPGAARIVTVDHVEVVRVPPDAVVAGCANPSPGANGNAPRAPGTAG